MNDIYENIEKCKPNKQRKIFIIFDDIIADLLSNKKLTSIVIELGRKLNIYLAFIIQFYFSETKSIRLNCTHYFIIKISNKQELQQVAFNHLSNIRFKNFMNIYEKCIAKPYYFLVIYSNPLRLGKNLLKRV